MTFDLVAVFAGAGNDVPTVLVSEAQREHIPQDWRHDAVVAEDASDILDYY